MGSSVRPWEGEDARDRVVDLIVDIERRERFGSSL